MLVNMILLLALLGVGYWLCNVIYSILLSPLRHLPSPLIYQLFPTYYHIRLAMGDSPQVIHACFLKYGKVFRVGWDRVLFVDGQAANDMYATYRFAKSPLYEAFNYYGENIISLKVRDVHALRKRIVQNAFTKPSIHNMQSKIIKVGIEPLLANMHAAANTKAPMDLYHVMHYYVWDVIGILAFGESFMMLKSDTHREAIEWMYSVLQFGLNKLAFPILRHFKSSDGEKLRKFSNWVIKRYYKRLEEKTTTPTDIIGHFVSSDKMTLDEILSETFVQLFGATDTVANALTWFFYLVLTHPKVELGLVNELKSHNLFNLGTVLTLDEILDKLPYFEAVLKETLRYCPVVATTPMRTAPEGGATVMGVHLPGGTKVGIPMFSIHRSHLAFDRPDEFLPERWLGNVQTPQRKNLAWAQLHLVCINVLANFKLTLVDPNEGKEMSAPPILRPKSGRLNVTLERRTA
ncbi:hypothetical protein L0F63_005710 [Massospora cicadina]|nr:hypothetical protein L0F63_005710 [Massospora cicadina]